MDVIKSVGGTAVELAKNDNVLNKTVGFLGMLFPYAGLEKKAAELYIEEIEKSDLPVEAKLFSILNAKKYIKKVKNQKEIVDIAMVNAKEGTDFSEKSGVNEDWLERYMDSAGFVSSEEMQLIWGKILAKEFEKPGTTPPNMIRVLSEITPSLAVAFKKICSMKVWIYPLTQDEKIANVLQRVLVPYAENVNEFQKLGITFNILNELETLGVIKVETLGSYCTKGIENEKVLIQIDDKLELIVKHSKGQVSIGNVMLTSVGEALIRITDDEEIPNYRDMVKRYMVGENVVFAEKHDFKMRVNGEAIYISK